MHIHVHIVDLLEDICEAIQFNKIEPDVYISYNSEGLRKPIETILSENNVICSLMLKTPNRGRDIGPFLTGIGSILDKNYDIYGHIHTKKSVHIDKKLSCEWREFLIGNLLGDKRIR